MDTKQQHFKIMERHHRGAFNNQSPTQLDIGETHKYLSLLQQNVFGSSRPLS